MIAAAGTIGVVIPPSVPMVLYAVSANQSLSQLFANGFGPGLLMGAILIVIALVQAYRYNYPKGTKFSLKNVVGTFLRAIPALIMPAIILGGIFSGKFTASEAAAVAVVYALLVSFLIYRDMTPQKLYEIMKGSAKTSAIIMIIIACSGPFGWVLANYKIPEAIAGSILGISTNKYILMFVIALVIIIAGVFMETSSAIIILTPVFLPLVQGIGVDLVHFGILFVVGIAIGTITPPVAINLFVASGITGKPIELIAKAVIPSIRIAGGIPADCLYAAVHSKSDCLEGQFYSIMKNKKSRRAVINCFAGFLRLWLNNTGAFPLIDNIGRAEMPGHNRIVLYIIQQSLSRCRTTAALVPRQGNGEMGFRIGQLYDVAIFFTKVEVFFHPV